MPFILVASGDQDIRLTLQQQLEGDGFTVIIASESEACLALARHQNPDALILDAALTLPQGDSLAASLHAAHPDIPILAIIAADADAEYIYKEGVSDIISPPIQKAVLRQRLRLLLSQSELRRLSHQDDSYRSIVENTSEGVFRSTPEGRFIFANAGLVRLLGYDSLKEVLALDIPRDVYFHPDVRRQIQVKSDSLDDMLSFELALKTKSGSPIPVNVSSKAVRNADGTIGYYEGIMIDLSEKKRTESALYQFSEELQSKTQSMQTINAIADLVYEALDVQTVVDRALDALLGYFKVSGATLQLVDESGEYFYRLSGRELSDVADQLTAVIPMRGTLSGAAVLTRELIVSEPLQTETRLNPQVRDDLIAGEITRLVVVPLLSQGNAIGTITLPLHNERLLTTQEGETLAAAGKTIGLAIANAQYVQRIEAEVQERLRIEFSEHQQRVLAEALRDTAAMLNGDLDQDRILDQILIQMERVISVQQLECDAG